MVYAIHILGLVIFKFCQLSKKQSMLDELEIHVRNMAFQDNDSISLKWHDLLLDRIYKVYSRYIPCIYYAYTMRRSLASPVSCPSALGSIRPGLPSELLSFGHREAAHARLGPSKVPQPYPFWSLNSLGHWADKHEGFRYYSNVVVALEVGGCRLNKDSFNI